MLFEDRHDAGRRLADALREYRGTEAVVLGIPRGGVVVAEEIARALDLPLDVTVSRKIGAPETPELAIGAVAADGTVYTDSRLEAYLPGLNQEYLQRVVAREVAEIERRLKAYRGDRPPVDLTGKNVLVVDDGIATGSTMLVTLRSLRGKQAKEIVLAVPVAPPSAIERLRPEADRVVVLEQPELFYAVGEWYRDFTQVSDEEVIALLAQAHAREHAAAPS